jgi:hypothetical protein
MMFRFVAFAATSAVPGVRKYWGLCAPGPI